LIRVLIADDHPFVRETLADLFAGTEDIAVVAECADGNEVLLAVQRTRPDVVLIDDGMPRMPGLEASRALLEAQPDSRVLMLTGRFSPASFREAHSLGVKGYLLKGDDPSDLIQRVREVAAGGTAWSPSAAEHPSTHG
jgi:DNA-binding NarL/FixJ family response regulator